MTKHPSAELREEPSRKGGPGEAATLGPDNLRASVTQPNMVAVTINAVGCERQNDVGIVLAEVSRKLRVGAARVDTVQGSIRPAKE